MKRTLDKEGTVTIMLVGRVTKNLFRWTIGLVVVFTFGLAAWATTPGINIGPNGMISGGTVTSGLPVTVTGSGTSASINTASNQTIIKYDRFNINEGWNINIQQPNSASATLNRVTGGCVSEIMGTFRSNGQVFLVNPAGVLFGSGARINMPKLVASGLSLSDDDFRKMAGSPAGDDMVNFTAPTSGGRIMMLWDQDGCGVSRPQFSTDQLYLIGTQVENCAKIVGNTDGVKPYVVMAASTGNVMVSNWGKQNVLVEVKAGTSASTDPVPSEEAGDGHQNYEPGKGHTLFQNGHAYGHVKECTDCLTTALGTGDIYSLAVVDTSLVAMSAQRDITVMNDPATGSHSLGRGSLGSDGNILLDADRNTTIDKDVTAGGRVRMAAGLGNYVGGSVTAQGTSGIAMTAGVENSVGGNVAASAGPVAMTATAGMNDVGGSVSGTSVAMTAGSSNLVDGGVTGSTGAVRMIAKSGDNKVGTGVSGQGVYMDAKRSNIVSAGGVDGGEGLTEMYAGGNNSVTGNVTGLGVIMDAWLANTVTGGVDAGSGEAYLQTRTGQNTVGGDVTGGSVVMNAATSNVVGGGVTATDGSVSMTAGHKNQVATGVSGTSVYMDAKTDNIISAGGVTATDGTVEMYAGGNNNVTGDVTGTGVIMDAWLSNSVIGNVDGGEGSVTMRGNTDQNKVTGDVTGTSVEMVAGAGNIVGGNVTASSGGVYITGVFDNNIDGDVTAMNGNVGIASGAGSNFLGGDVIGQGNVDVSAYYDNVLDGAGDQTLKAEAGTLTVGGETDKTTAGNLFMQGGSDGLAVDIQGGVHTTEGNIEILGNGDVQLGGDITAGAPCCGTFADFARSVQSELNYGVKIVSQNGQIYTGTPENGINIAITGGSDQMAGRGVDLPFEAGQKAGIILMSKGDLKLGPDAMLAANGTYYADGSVDDRAAVAFRSTSTWQGVPIDIGLYLKSVEGNISVDHLGQLNLVAPGTAVVDAFNYATLVNKVVGQTIICNDPYFLYRLEVASRQILWLQEAIDTGKLPFPEDFPLAEQLMGGGTFVLRGGVDPEGIDGAWVLHGPEAKPIPTIPALATTMTPTEDGCPALLQAAAEEIGQDPAIFRTGTFVSMKSMQPCSTCERLVRTANVLKDPDGKRIAALGQALGEFATGAAPLSPEQMATASQTMALHVNDGTAYASAKEYVDALAAYVGILQSEVGLNQADALALATGRYGSPANSSDAVKAFIAQQLAQKAG
jgi:filamentous hemagglutinin family protein